MAPVITVMGPIGAGKTLQAEMLAKRLGWETFSTGQLIRDDTNEAARADMHSGKLAPTGYVQDLVLAKIKSLAENKGIILDGSPRMLPEAERLDRELPDMGRKLNLVIYLDVDEPTVEGRLAKRGRADDHPETIKVRWNEFERDTLPTVEHYRALGAVKVVDGHRSPQEVNDQIMEVLRHANLA